MPSNLNFEIRLFRRKLFDVGFRHPENPYTQYCVCVPNGVQRTKRVCDYKVKLFNDGLVKHTVVKTKIQSL